ncbi:MAG: hypothetical protein P8J87_14125 [Verrucomicrobiales bacterium]|nr:hypothetical protein [Verrucomicrobiales bacterium]
MPERYPVKAGWNAIWLPHDCFHAEISDLVPASVEEIWRWNPLASTTQFTDSPSAPIQPDTQWFVWKNGIPLESTMTEFTPNAAYLIKVAEGSPDFTLELVGSPVPPVYRWKSSGVNLLGFPMQTPVDPTTRNFESFLSYSADISAGPDIFKYDGGALGSNPVQVFAPLLEPVRRGQAYWIRSTQFSDYYGPLRVTVARSGLSFGDAGTILSLRVANVTSEPVAATLAAVASANAPPGQAAVAGEVPLRLRGGIDPATGQFQYDNFSAPVVQNLAAGQEVELIFAVDRTAMIGAAGDVFQSILQITDSTNISRINLPVSARVSSRSGLWVGAAVVSKVDQITTSPSSVATTDPAGFSTDADASAPAAFPIRLILHRDDSAEMKLLQQVFVGEDAAGERIVATAESFLEPAKIGDARRLSSAIFPLDTKVAGSGDDLGLTGSAMFTFSLPYDAPTNPFVHTYHPDHDNKDARFSAAPLPEGAESSEVTRSITLTFVSDPASLGVSDLEWGSAVLGGDYAETITGLRAQAINVKGSFVLRRVSKIPILQD